MKYYSTNGAPERVSFREACIRGQAPDKGLYFPELLPVHDPVFLTGLKELSDAEIAFRVIRPYAGESIQDEELYRICSETVDFPIPLVKIREGISSLELFHGPTLAFKDIGARFMSRCLGHFLREDRRTVTVLVATSGDTGGAVASGFHNVENVNVIILYPSGKVSPVQEQQLTTLGGNIRAIEVSGTFDDCQALVKSAFMDPVLNERFFLTSANSINVARWLPQQFYYFFAWKQWLEPVPPVISVPSGNFGNICAGLLASQTGLPVKKFIAACNANDVVTRYLQTGVYDPRKAVATLSNAMDVGEPSNFIRIREIARHSGKDLPEILVSQSITDEETLATIRDVKKQHGYLLDPHGAVAYKALTDYQQLMERETPFLQPGMILETAHPVKFPTAIEQATGEEVTVPDSISNLMSRTKKADTLTADFNSFREFLLR